MNKEIKEIELDHFNSIEELKRNVEMWIREEDMYWDRWFGLYDLKQLLDYITNLETIEQQYSAILSENAELENKITNLEQENELLKKQMIAMTQSNYKLGMRCNGNELGGDEE